ncbi:DUF3846 domain-containing protein [Rhodococcus opacus]|uniref:DUF3846 domain-containing protein n=1 Tax=Rhodococcus opacus TaxID=37919 RepID=UPI0022355667|nr:DUF3846 domain-containing protein [Rhodococcus opacus]UZG58023.1 DUF3846 domain-containing protein [Rhodococcus opacus]
MITGLRLSTTGEVSRVEIDEETYGTLHEAIGCDCFTRVGLPDIDMFCDDNGWVIDRPQFNHTATVIVRAFDYDSPIAGNVVFLGADGRGGNVSLTDDQVKLLGRMAQMIAVGDE